MRREPKEPRLKKLAVFEVAFHGKGLTASLDQGFQEFELFQELYAHKFAEERLLVCETRVSRAGRRLHDGTESVEGV